MFNKIYYLQISLLIKTYFIIRTKLVRIQQSKLGNILKINFWIFITIILILFFQENVIYPIEKEFFNMNSIKYVSLLFLPHGIKIIAFFLYRELSIIPLFLAPFIYGLTFPINIGHFFGCLVGLISIIIGFFICSYLLKPITIKNSKLPIWRQLIVAIIISCLINAMLQSAIASIYFKDYNLNILFLFGDLFGSLSIVCILMFFRKKIIKVLSL